MYLHVFTTIFQWHMNTYSNYIQRSPGRAFNVFHQRRGATSKASHDLCSTSPYASQHIHHWMPFFILHLTYHVYDFCLYFFKQILQWNMNNIKNQHPWIYTQIVRSSMRSTAERPRWWDLDPAGVAWVVAVSTCFNMFQHVSTCFNMFQPHVAKDFKIFQASILETGSGPLACKCCSRFLVSKSSRPRMAWSLSPDLGRQIFCDLPLFIEVLVQRCSEFAYVKNQRFVMVISTS